VNFDVNTVRLRFVAASSTVGTMTRLSNIKVTIDHDFVILASTLIVTSHKGAVFLLFPVQFLHFCVSDLSGT
jgi:hypothetical protein